MIAATLAFAGAAFAAWEAKDVKSLAQDDGATTQNMGKVTETAAPNHDSTPENGQYEAKVYYFDKIDDSNKATAGVKLEAGTAASTEQFIYGVNYQGKENFGTATSGVATGEITLKDTNDVTYKFGVDGNSDFDTNQLQASLTLTPVNVELEMPEQPIVIMEGTEATIVQIKLKDKTLTPHFFGGGFKADTPQGHEQPPTVGPADEPGKLVIYAGSAADGTYVFQVNINPDSKNVLTVDEAGCAQGIKVANFPTSEVPVGEMTVIVRTYVVTPASGDWSITSPEVVKFSVDMKPDDFDSVGISAPGEERFSDVPSDHYTVTPTADGIEIEIDLEFLVANLDRSGEYLFNAADKNNLQGIFALTVEGKYGLPKKGVAAPSGAESAPTVVQFGIVQTQHANDDRIMDLMPPDMQGYFSEGEGTARSVEVANLLSVDEEALTIFPVVETELSEDKRIAAFTFEVTGELLISEGIDGIKWSDAIIHKMFASGERTASVKLAPIRTFDAIKNGTYMILDENGELLPDDHVIKRDVTKYKLVVYVEDDTDYDLNKTPLSVIDPLIVQEYSGGGSSSGCASGAAVLVAIAAVAVMKRRMR